MLLLLLLLNKRRLNYHEGVTGRLFLMSSLHRSFECFSLAVTDLIFFQGLPDNGHCIYLDELQDQPKYCAHLIIFISLVSSTMYNTCLSNTWQSCNCKPLCSRQGVFISVHPLLGPRLKHRKANLYRNENSYQRICAISNTKPNLPCKTERQGR